MSSCTLCSPDSLVETKALELLKKVYAHFEAKHNTYNKDAPGHAHYKKGLWDKDGERCGWCATWEEVRAHINVKDNGQSPVDPLVKLQSQSILKGEE